MSPPRAQPQETARVGKRGTVVIPSRMRRALDLHEGDLMVVEVRDGGLLLRAAVAMPVELYTPARRAELLLANAIDDADLQAARAEIASWGLSPDGPTAL